MVVSQERGPFRVCDECPFIEESKQKPFFFQLWAPIPCRQIWEVCRSPTRTRSVVPAQSTWRMPELVQLIQLMTFNYKIHKNNGLFFPNLCVFWHPPTFFLPKGKLIPTQDSGAHTNLSFKLMRKGKSPKTTSVSICLMLSYCRYIKLYYIHVTYICIMSNKCKYVHIYASTPASCDCQMDDLWGTKKFNMPWSPNHHPCVSWQPPSHWLEIQSTVFKHQLFFIHFIRSFWRKLLGRLPGWVILMCGILKIRLGRWHDQNLVPFSTDSSSLNHLGKSLHFIYFLKLN